MTKAEMKAFEKLFDYASGLMGNRGCNDTDPEILAMFTSEELTEMEREFHDYNGDPEEYEEGFYFSMGNDFCLFQTLFNKIKKELGE